MIYVPIVPHISYDEDDPFDMPGYRKSLVTVKPKKIKKSLLSKSEAELLINKHSQDIESTDILSKISFADISKTEYCDG